uniref:Uncharacterized protein n=1 Tax=Arundo donax TaxID=35708 RepID=A0A0A8YTF5_ARUDO
MAACGRNQPGDRRSKQWRALCPSHLQRKQGDAFLQFAAT